MGWLGVSEYLLLIVGIAVVLVGGALDLRHDPARGRRDALRTADAPAPTQRRTDTEDDRRRRRSDLTVRRRPSRPPVEKPESAASRLVRLRQRLARSQSPLGRGLLALLSRDVIDEDTWEEIEDTLITADVGVTPTQELVARLRTRRQGRGQLVGVRAATSCTTSWSRSSTRAWTARWP